MPKILFVTHSPLLTTGYGRNVRMIGSALAAAGHEIIVLGLGYENEPHDLPIRILPWKAFEDTDAIAAAIDAEKPALLFTIGDPWMFATLPDLPQRRGLTWLAYFPVDGFPLPLEWKRWIAAVDIPIVYCNWTADLIQRETGHRPHVIYHGVDTATFHPADKAQAKARVGVSNSFVVGCVAANQQPQNLPALIRAFATFAIDKPEAILYLHTQIAGYWDIEELVRTFGVEPKTRATLNLNPQHGVTDEILATIYNAMDIFVLPTMAEGFGNPIFESQACGVPALVTDFSSCSELVPEPINRLRVLTTIIMARNFEQAIVDESDLATKLNRLYNDRPHLARLSNQAKEFVQPYQWPAICEQFVSLIKLHRITGVPPVH